MYTAYKVIQDEFEAEGLEEILEEIPCNRASILALLETEDCTVLIMKDGERYAQVILGCAACLEDPTVNLSSNLKWLKEEQKASSLGFLVLPQAAEIPTTQEELSHYVKHIYKITTPDGELSNTAVKMHWSKYVEAQPGHKAVIMDKLSPLEILYYDSKESTLVGSLNNTKALHLVCVIPQSKLALGLTVDSIITKHTASILTAKSWSFKYFQQGITDSIVRSLFFKVKRTPLDVALILYREEGHSWYRVQDISVFTNDDLGL